MVGETITNGFCLSKLVIKNVKDPSVLPDSC